MLEDTIYNSAYVSGYNDALKEIKEAIKELADFDTVDVLVKVAWLIDEHKKAVQAAEGEVTKNERLSNSEMVSFLAFQFDTSRNTAKSMLHELIELKRMDNFKKRLQ